MNRRLTALVLVLALLPASSVFAQDPFDPPPTTRHRSVWLAVAGGLTAATGSILLLSTVDWPADTNGDGSLGTTYTINGDRYCVTSGATYVNVNDWGCSTGGRLLDPKYRPALTIMTLAGTALFVVGFQQVQVAPMVGTRRGVQASVRWGK